MKKYHVERINLSKDCYASFVRTYGVDLSQNVLDAFELKLFCLPKDLFVSIIADEVYEVDYYQTITIVYELCGQYYRQRCFYR